MVTFLMEMFDELSQSEIEQFKQWLSQYFHCMNKLPGVRNVLHFSCDGRLSVSTIQLFLTAGANPNSTDENGNTPVQLIARNSYDGSYPNRLVTGDMLVIAGALVDGGASRQMYDNKGMSPLEMFKAKWAELIQLKDLEFQDLLDALINAVVSLDGQGPPDL